MMNKRLLIILSILLVSSCKAQPKVHINENEGINSNFVTKLQRFHDADGYVATASKTGVYMLDKGLLKYVDHASMDEALLANLNYADDNEIIGECNEDFKQYCEIADPDFLQFYDNHLFYAAQRITVEGNNEYILYRMTPDGTKRESILSIESNPYLLTISKGHLFYVDGFTQDVMVVNLNTKETHKIILPDDQSFSYFRFSEDNFYIESRNSNESKTYLHRFDFSTRELFQILSGDIEVNDGDGDNLLLYDVKNYDPLVAERKIVNQKYEVIGELRDETRLLNYLDANYIYTSSVQRPQKYVIYDHQGSIKYEVAVPEDFKPDFDNIVSVQGRIECSQIQGIIGDYLFVIGGTDEGIGYYMVNFKTGEWHSVFQSVVEVTNNG